MWGHGRLPNTTAIGRLTAPQREARAAVTQRLSPLLALPVGARLTDFATTLRCSTNALRTWTSRAAALLLVLILAVVFQPRGHVQAEPPAVRPEMAADAELTDVFFQDADRGWCIGDRGVVLATVDGGRKWQLQPTSTGCRWESIHFADERHGWIVGGWTHPYTQVTRGVILRTRDGGRTWARIPGLMLPALHRVKFVDGRRGWAAGSPSSLYPSAVFRTQDGGQTWESVAMRDGGPWTTGDFPDARRGVVAGEDGALGVVSATEVKPATHPELGGRSFRRLQLFGPTSGWLVGESGLILRTRDGGLSWQRPSERPSESLAQLLDLNAIATFGSHCWLAGAPGTCVLHTSDDGAHWDVFRTEQSTPLNAVTFVDEHHGWAVGSLGTILASRDGGRTWRVQRAGGTRVAILSLVSEVERTPFELFAAMSGGEGYLGAAEAFAARSDRRSNRHFHEALVAVGGSAANATRQFVVDPLWGNLDPESMLAVWETTPEGPPSDATPTEAGATPRQAGDLNQPPRGAGTRQRLEARLVSRIRQWRPDVIITEPPASRGGDGLAELTHQLVLASVQQAADPSAHVEQLSEAGLATWQVKKIFAIDTQGTMEIQRATDKPLSRVSPRAAPLSPRGGRQFHLNTSQLSPAQGLSLAEIAASGRGLVIDAPRSVPETLGFELLSSRVAQNTSRPTIFGGIVLQQGGEARRGAVSLSGNLESLTRAAQRRRNFERLIERSDASRDAIWLGNVNEMLKGVSESGAGSILFQLASRYRTTGKPDLAVETLELLVSKYPDHDLAESAILSLIRHYGSEEIAWQFQGRQVGFDGEVLVDGEVRPASAELPSVVVPSAVVPSVERPRREASSSLPAAPSRAPDRLGRAVAFGATLESTSTELHADARARLPLASIARRQGLIHEAEKLYRALGNRGVGSPGRSAAAGELWLLSGQGEPPKHLARSVRAAERPHLDGRLDEPFWSEPGILLKAAGLESATTQFLLAYDAEYLYVAVVCGKAETLEYPPRELPRVHDEDLSAGDRMEFWFDIDRDYASAYHFSVDHRGRTRDACCDDESWNPTWYVASTADERTWTCEIAIPMSGLASQSPSGSTVWALNIRRTLPGLGSQTWSSPDFGLLTFKP